MFQCFNVIQCYSILFNVQCFNASMFRCSMAFMNFKCPTCILNTVHMILIPKPPPILLSNTQYWILSNADQYWPIMSKSQPRKSLKILSECSNLPFKSLKVFKVLSKGCQEDPKFIELKVVIAMFSSVLWANYYHSTHYLAIHGFFSNILFHLWKGLAPLKSPCKCWLAVKITQIYDSTEALVSHGSS